jgi:hypothetical protein
MHSFWDADRNAGEMASMQGTCMSRTAVVAVVRTHVGIRLVMLDHKIVLWEKRDTQKEHAVYLKLM